MASTEQVDPVDTVTPILKSSTFPILKSSKLPTLRSNELPILITSELPISKFNKHISNDNSNDFLDFDPRHTSFFSANPEELQLLPHDDPNIHGKYIPAPNADILASTEQVDPVDAVLPIFKLNNIFKSVIPIFKSDTIVKSVLPILNDDHADILAYTEQVNPVDSVLPTLAPSDDDFLDFENVDDAREEAFHNSPQYGFYGTLTRWQPLQETSFTKSCIQSLSTPS